MVEEALARAAPAPPHLREGHVTTRPSEGEGVSPIASGGERALFCLYAAGVPPGEGGAQPDTASTRGHCPGPSSPSLSTRGSLGPPCPGQPP